MSRQLSGIRKTTMREQLAPLLTDDEPDRYGEGGPVAALEARVAAMLGTEAALFVPTGTMPQQIALRYWAERSGNAVVAMHPLAHPLMHEEDALFVLTGLRAVRLAKRPELLITAADVIDCPERFGTLLLELPQREAGFLMAAWDELAAVAAAARTRGAVLHLDGARLWESQFRLGKSLAEIAGLFDSLYVSFYKALGGISGAALAGTKSFVDEARVWRHRYGGMLFGHWPAALSALHGLSVELPKLGAYVEHAKSVAAALGVAEPHTHQFALYLPGSPDRINTVRGDFLGKFWPSAVPGLAKTEVTVAGPALDWTHDQIVDAYAAFLASV